MANKKVKPGTPHPTKKGLVMGKNGSYVSKTTYAKQVTAAQTSNTGNPQTPPSKGGALVKQGSSAITKPSNKGGGLAKTGGSQKALPGSNPKALPPGKPGGGLKISGGGAASRALGALGIAGGTAAEIQEMRDRAARDAERNKKLNRRPFEELRADSRTRPSGSSTQTGQGSRKPTAPKPTDKQIAALTQKGGIFYQGPGKPKDTPKPSVSDKSKTKPTVSKTEPKPKPQGQSKDMGENYRRWAAANPKLAAKVKEGQAGYAELKGSKAKPTASKKGSTSPSSAVKPPAKSKPKPQNFLSLSERMKKKRGY